MHAFHQIFFFGDKGDKGDKGGGGQGGQGGQAAGFLVLPILSLIALFLQSAEAWTEEHVVDYRMLDGAMNTSMSLTVSAGTQASRRIQLPTGGSAVLNFSLDEFDITASFAAEAAEGPRGLVVLEAMEKALSGRFVHTAVQPCTIHVTFDNTYSVIRSKKLSIKLSGYPPGVPVPAEEDEVEGKASGAREGGVGEGLASDISGMPNGACPN